MTIPFILSGLLAASAGAAAPSTEPLPTPAWTRRWDSPAHSHDMAWGLAVTPAGRVYVSGWSARPDLKDGSNAWLGAYDADGRLAWIREQNSPAAFDGWHNAAVDAAGGVFVTGASFRPHQSRADTLIVHRYAADGRLVWSDTRNGAGTENYGLAPALDTAGRLRVTGFEYRPGSADELDMNIWTRGYDAALVPAWDRSWSGAPAGKEEGQGLAVDAAGNVYVTGWEERLDRGEGLNAWVAKYSAEGDLVWSRTGDFGRRADEVGLGIAVSARGEVYVTGWEDRPDLGESYNVWVERLTTDGAPVWRATYDSPAHAFDYAHAAVLDRAGNLLIAGYEDRPDLGEDTNGWIRSYAPDGAVRWTLSYVGEAHAGDIAWGVGVDAAGNIYAAGGEERPDLGQEENIWVRKWSAPATEPRPLGRDAARAPAAAGSPSRASRPGAPAGAAPASAPGPR